MRLEVAAIEAREGFLSCVSEDHVLRLRSVDMDVMEVMVLNAKVVVPAQLLASVIRHDVSNDKVEEQEKTIGVIETSQDWVLADEDKVAIFKRESTTRKKQCELPFLPH